MGKSCRVVLNCVTVGAWEHTRLAFAVLPNVRGKRNISWNASQCASYVGMSTECFVSPRSPDFLISVLARVFRWVDTAVFFPAGRSQEVGFAVTSMVKLMKKLPLQARKG